MADTIRERIIAAFTDKAAPLSGLPIDRATRSMGETSDRFISIWDGQDQAQAPVYGRQQMQFPIALECIWRYGSDNPSIAANALMGEIITLMMAGDTTYAGLARRTVLTAIEPSYPVDGSDYTTLTAIFTIDYAMTVGDPYTVPPY